MAQKKTKKYRPKKKLGRFFSMPSVEKWIPESENDPSIERRVKKLNNLDFEKILNQVALYNVLYLLNCASNLAIAERLRFYSAKLKKDILQISGKRISEKKTRQLDQLLKSGFFEIDSKINGFLGRYILELSSKHYPRVFRSAVDLLENADNFSYRRMRDNITYQFYMDVVKIKWLCKMRDKKNGLLLYEQFLSKYIFKDPYISNFLRGGKSKKTSMDIRDFENVRYRFLKYYRQQQ